LTAEEPEVFNRIKMLYKNSMVQFENTTLFARELDENDPLKNFRKKFIIPVHDGKEQIYFLGNSLGLQPCSAADEIKNIMNNWADYGVEGFFKGTKPWMDYHDQLTGPLSKIVGALPQEVVVMNQLTVNLHLMLISFYKPQGKRFKILCEAKAFPSDQYMFETHVKHHARLSNRQDFNPDEAIIEVKPREGEECIQHEDILKAIELHGDELALVMFSGINYYTGQLFNMQSITAAAQKAGAKVGFDLAHAAGNVPMQMHDWNVDFACWCSYKYLNSGPGAVGGVYIHERYHSDKDITRFAGWWGYDKATRFLMHKGFVPVNTAEGWQLSTPSLLLYACHKAALDITEEAGWENINKKRKLLNNYLWFVLEGVKAKHPDTIKFITPANEDERGCQVSMLMLKNGKHIYNELMKRGVIVDWREPNVIRLAPVPLYNSFEEVWTLADNLQQILETIK
jgi:kynureninase